ncbi:MAG: amino acid permease [Acidobacteriota bacterium]
MVDRSKRLEKQLGLAAVYAIATGTTLSAGFFLLPGLAAQQAGPSVVLAYMIAAVPLVPAMFSVLELATAMPRAGGVYYFLDRSLGPLAGTVGGLGTWLALMLKVAFALVGMGAYLRLYLPEVPITPVAVTLALVLGILNLWGAKGSAKVQALLVTGLLAILAVFLGVGVPSIDPNAFEGFFDSGLDSLLGTAGFVYISYVGVTKVASLSEEVENPERNLPVGVCLGLATAVLIYGLGTAVMVGVLPMEELAGDLTPVASAAGRLLGPWGEAAIALGAAFAFLSVANAGTLSASRYPLAMSRDGLLPKGFQRLGRGRNPIVGVLVTIGLIVSFLLLLDPVKIAKLASAFQLLMFALVCLAVMVMRESRIESYDPGYRSPFYPWMQILGILAPLVLIFEMGWLSILFSAALVAGAVLWYFLYARRRVVRSGALFHVFLRLARSRLDLGLDRELRQILKEKGLREEDPFEGVVARAPVLEIDGREEFDHLALRVARELAPRLPATAEELTEGFLQGTRIGATPSSLGVSLPHLRLFGIDEPEMVMVRSRAGMRVDVTDVHGAHSPEDPVHALFFLVSPEEDPKLHLRILAQIAERVDDEGFMAEWMEAPNEQVLKEVLLRDERFLSLQVASDSPAGRWAGSPLSGLDLPEGALVALVRRNGRTHVPGGATVLEMGDRLTVLGEPEAIRRLRREHLSLASGG